MLITKKKFADDILGMTFGTLRDIACELAAMIEDKDARPRLKNYTDFVELLYDWADNQEE